MAYTPFPIYAVSIGYPHIAPLAAAQGITTDVWWNNSLADIVAHHCNAVLVYAMPFAQLADVHARCQAVGLKLIPQGDNKPAMYPFWDAHALRIADVNPGDDFYDYKVAYTAWLATYGASDTILAWSIAEELDATHIADEALYFNWLTLQDTKHPALITYNDPDVALAAAAAMTPFYLEGDKYIFFVSPLTPNTPDDQAKCLKGSGAAPYNKGITQFKSAASSCGAYLWTALQGHALWNNGDGTYHLRQPTYPEMRWQILQTIACGATGIFIYLYTSTDPAAAADRYYGLRTWLGVTTEAWEAVHDAWHEMQIMPTKLSRENKAAVLASVRGG